MLPLTSLLAIPTRAVSLRQHCATSLCCLSPGGAFRCFTIETMNHVPLIELTRGGTLECQHFGSVAVVNAQGKLLAHAGDAHWLTFSRAPR